MLIQAQRIVQDSEGAGRYRGAPAAYLEFGPVDASLEVISVIDGNVSPALGARGGEAGASGTVAKREKSGGCTALDPFLRVILEPGETLVSTSHGGGGYGPPEERDRAAVRHDLAEGYISLDRAREVYGLVDDLAESDE
jgi:N-methylhydantoinase B